MTTEFEVPDFSGWTTSRLKFMQEEYRESLGSIRVLYGKNHPEYRLYEKWLEAIKVELDKPYRRWRLGEGYD